jgi:hypothetical protein
VNDIENRLRALTFREPPPGLRGIALAPRVARWRTPPAAAWAALAATWLVLTAMDRVLDTEPKAADGHAPPVAALVLDQPTPLAFHIRVLLGRPELQAL